MPEEPAVPEDVSWDVAVVVLDVAQLYAALDSNHQASLDAR